MVNAPARLLWIDASAGVAGDMLLGALVDVGAPLEVCQVAVDSVIPGGVRLAPSLVTRAGLRAAAVRVEPLADDPSHRSWATIRALLADASLSELVRDRALAAFGALARAEAHVHGLQEDDVHFHEAGSWDSIADVVAVSAAVDALAVEGVIVGTIGVGVGTVHTQHGVLPVPAPAVMELCRGWSVTSGGSGELATPTGVALVTTLATGRGALPSMIVEKTGVGAGHRDRPDRPNVVRVVLGHAAGQDAPNPGEQLEHLLLLETTVDDLDPRVWPTVVDDLLTVGAADVWLGSVLMKKGRPGHLLSVLAPPAAASALRTAILERTSSLGVRQSTVHRQVLDRSWFDVVVGDTTIPVKIGHRHGVIRHATPEFDDVVRWATRTGQPVRSALEAASAAAVAAGVVPDSAVPDDARPER